MTRLSLQLTHNYFHHPHMSKGEWVNEDVSGNGVLVSWHNMRFPQQPLFWPEQVHCLDIQHPSSDVSHSATVPYHSRPWTGSYVWGVHSQFHQHYEFCKEIYFQWARGDWQLSFWLQQNLLYYWWSESHLLPSSILCLLTPPVRLIPFLSGNCYAVPLLYHKL